MRVFTEQPQEYPKGLNPLYTIKKDKFKSFIFDLLRFIKIYCEIFRDESFIPFCDV
jgi:hypothetical protein